MPERIYINHSKTFFSISQNTFHEFIVISITWNFNNALYMTYRKKSVTPRYCESLLSPPIIDKQTVATCLDKSISLVLYKQMRIFVDITQLFSK